MKYFKFYNLLKGNSAYYVGPRFIEASDEKDAFNKISKEFNIPMTHIQDIEEISKQEYDKLTETGLSREVEDRINSGKFKNKNAIKRVVDTTKFFNRKESCGVTLDQLNALEFLPVDDLKAIYDDDPDDPMDYDEFESMIKRVANPESFYDYDYDFFYKLIEAEHPEFKRNFSKIIRKNFGKDFSDKERVALFYINVFNNAVGGGSDFKVPHPLSEYTHNCTYWTGGSQNKEEIIDFIKSAPAVFGVKLGDYIDEDSIMSLDNNRIYNANRYGLKQDEVFGPPNTWKHSSNITAAIGLNPFEEAIFPLIPKIFTGDTSICKTAEDRQFLAALSKVDLAKETSGWMSPEGYLSVIGDAIGKKLSNLVGLPINFIRNGMFVGTGSIIGFDFITDNVVKFLFDNADAIANFKKKYPDAEFDTYGYNKKYFIKCESLIDSIDLNSVGIEVLQGKI